MSKFLKAVLAATVIATPVVADEKLGIGRIATQEEVNAWNWDVSPNGDGLPVGAGTAEWGDEVFAEYCAMCHGDFAEGVDNWPPLAGGIGSLANTSIRPVKTVGSYWPYLSTTFDYIRRSMPFGNAGILSVDETYAITAYILYSNGVVDYDFELNNENFLDVPMDNENGFIIDDRETIEYSKFRRSDVCMENCRDTEVEIIFKASDVNVTPED